MPRNRARTGLLRKSITGLSTPAAVVKAPVAMSTNGTRTGSSEIPSGGMATSSSPSRSLAARSSSRRAWVSCSSDSGFQRPRLRMRPNRKVVTTAVMGPTIRP